MKKLIICGFVLLSLLLVGCVSDLEIERCNEICDEANLTYGYVNSPIGDNICYCKEDLTPGVLGKANCNSCCEHGE